MSHRRLAGALLVGVVLVLASTAAAHPLAPALLQLRELDGGISEVVWKTPMLQPRGTALAPVFPSGCRALGTPTVRPEGDGLVQQWQLACTGGWIGASIGMTGLAETKTDTLVRVVLADGRILTSLLTAERPSFRVPERASRRDVARDYVVLGVEHLLTGLDHLLFVLGLVLIVASRRALLTTITAFTVAHSITLSLAVLGLVHVPSAPIELAIAVSILVLATEVAAVRRGTSSALARRPWLMAFGFGLLHGLGFAGALASVGLPDGEIPFALFSFNVGIELGQLLFVGAVLAAWLMVSRLSSRRPAWALDVPVYAMGSLAAFWCFERLVPLVQQLAL